MRLFSLQSKTKHKKVKRSSQEETQSVSSYHMVPSYLGYMQ